VFGNRFLGIRVRVIIRVRVRVRVQKVLRKSFKISFFGNFPLFFYMQSPLDRLGG
jgi:hypothetical protein